MTGTDGAAQPSHSVYDVEGFSFAGEAGSTMQLRRAAKWLATLAAVLLLAGFIASLRYQITIRNPGLWRLEISGGSARVSFSGVPGGSAPPGPVQFDAGAHTTPVAWWPRRYRRVGWPAADIPLWLLAAFVAVPPDAADLATKGGRLDVVLRTHRDPG